MLSIRSIAYLLLVTCVGAVLSFGQSQGMKSNSNPEDQITQLERDWLAADAKGDVGSLRRLISDDFIGSSFDGGLLRKGDIIPDNDGPGGFAGATTGETNVRVFGDTGVLMGVINTAGGPQSRQIRVVLVCQKRSEGWRMIAAQMTRVP
ncbi:MAG: nuclear transport factor 2 family protein [Terriglobales bacterium]|jgi:ketosteroid isomerase-like protein